MPSFQNYLFFGALFYIFFQCLHTETARIIIAQGFSWNRGLRYSKCMGSFESYSLCSLVFHLKNHKLNVLCRISVMVSYKSISNFIAKNLQPWLVWNRNRGFKL